MTIVGQEMSDVRARLVTNRPIAHCHHTRRACRSGHLPIMKRNLAWKLSLLLAINRSPTQWDSCFLTKIEHLDPHVADLEAVAEMTVRLQLQHFGHELGQQQMISQAPKGCGWKWTQVEKDVVLQRQIFQSCCVDSLAFFP